MPAKVVIDANALLIPFESGIRIEEELQRLLGPYEAFVPESVLHELATIAATAKGQRGANARMALAFSRRFSYRPTKATGDAAVLHVAEEEGALLFTNDRALLKQALAKRLSVIRVKGHSHLIVENAQGEVR